MTKLELLVDKTIRKYGLTEIESSSTSTTRITSGKLRLEYNLFLLSDMVKVYNDDIYLGEIPFHLFYKARKNYEKANGVPIIEQLLKEFE